MISNLTSAVRRIEPFFGPDDGWVETLRQTAWRRAQSVVGHKHTFVRDKGRADYVTTADAPPQRVARALYANGYQRNLMSTVKTRGDPPQYVHSAWVLDAEDTEWQQDVFLWENEDSTSSPSQEGDSIVASEDTTTTDVYSHKEPSVRRPNEHLDLSTGIHGDPDGRVRDVLHTAGIDYERNS